MRKAVKDCRTLVLRVGEHLAGGSEHTIPKTTKKKAKARDATFDVFLLPPQMDLSFSHKKKKMCFFFSFHTS